MNRPTTYGQPVCLPPMKTEMARFISRERQKDLSDLNNGRLEGYSVIYMMRLIEALGFNVALSITPNADAAVPERMAA